MRVVRVHRGADVISDHLVVAKIKIKLKTLAREEKRMILNTDSLKEEHTTTISAGAKK